MVDNEGHENHQCSHCGNNIWGYTCKKATEKESQCVKNRGCAWIPITHKFFEHNGYTYKLVEHGADFFHFRRGVESIMGAFTISFLHDGTIVLSGDYGLLAWKRNYYPPHKDLFPFDDTNIGYFAEKVFNSFNIKSCSMERALKEIEAFFRDEYFDEQQYKENEEKIKELLDEIEGCDYDDDTIMQHHFYNVLSESDFDTDWHEDTWGMGYTNHFRFQYSFLKKAMKLIRKHYIALAKKGEKNDSEKTEKKD